MNHEISVVFKEFIEHTESHDVIAVYQCETCKQMLLLKIGNRDNKSFDVNSFNIKTGVDMVYILHEREIL